MKTLLAAFFCGVAFAIGLSVGGMTQASKVHDFLDVTGAWDPSLAFVMGGAVLVHFVTLRWVLKRPSPLLVTDFVLPTRKDLDWKLLLGSAVFGAGWGLGGVCPGPGLTLLASGLQPAIIFVVSMVLAMVLFDAWQRSATRRTPTSGVSIAAAASTHSAPPRPE